MAKVYGILSIGQSNAEPTGILADYFALAPELDFRSLIPDSTVSPWYGWALEEVRMLTLACPEDVATYPVATPPPPFSTWLHYAFWLPWTIYEGGFDTKPNVNAPGFRYPNANYRPRGPLGNFSAPGVPAQAFPDGVSIGVDIGARLNGILGSPIYVIPAGIAGALLGVKATASANTPAQWGWWDSRMHGTWAPSDTDGLWTQLDLTLEGGVLAAEVEGVEVEIVLVHISQGESAANPANLAEKAEFANNAPRFVAAIRQLLYDKGLSKVAPHYIPVVWEKLSDTLQALNPTYDISVVNDVLTQMAADDPAFGTYSTDGLALPDGFHYDSAAIRARGASTVAEWQRIRNRNYQAMSLDDVPTLRELMQLVRTELDRNQATLGSPTETDAVIRQEINNTLNQLYQTAGDSAWWLRHMLTTNIISSPTNTVDLPRTVTRLLEIRPHTDRRDKLEWTMIGHTDLGRVQIMLNESYSGMCDLHCIFEPRALVGLEERPVCPWQYIDAVVMGAAWRVAHQYGQAELQLKLQQTASRLMERVSGHIGKVDRQRNMSITGHRAGRRWNFGGPSYMRRYRV